MNLDRTLSVAPMMDCTDRHDRWLLRLVSRHTLLYTEMITANALIHGDTDHLLRHDPFEQPVALQIGGSEPDAMASAARMGAARGYCEVNINAGCPSERVRSGAFGACLMAEPATVADCVRAMKDAVDVPVTVKTRIGIDDRDSYQFLFDFVGPVVAAGADAMIIHARKAWLQGLSPKENREIPPLDYSRVYQLKVDWPDVPIVLNGGVHSLAEVEQHRRHVDGCMLGRAAYRDPWLLAEADSRFWQRPQPLDSPVALVHAYLPYIRARLTEGVPLHHMTRHMSNLFSGWPGARAWRRTLSEGAAAGGDAAVVEQALAHVTAASRERVATTA